MSEIIVKLVKILEKLDNYYVLRQEDEHLILGTDIEFLEHKPEITQVFTTYSPKPIRKKLSVFFLVTNTAKASELDNFFLKKKLPILSINKHKLTLENVKELLEQFVINNFKY